MADEASATEPGDEVAARAEPGAARRAGGELRASHVDRDRAVEVLRVAAGDGRLTAAELDDRVGAALTARTYGELAALIADLPAAPGSLPLIPAAAPGVSPKDLVRIECNTGTARRDGPWLVPRRMEIRISLGTVTLDFTEAVVSWPALEIDADIHTGNLILVTGPGTLVTTDDLAINMATVNVDPPPGPDAAARFRINVSGRASMGSITARPPGLPPRPRRSFWQWLLRRGPGPRALPPGAR
jgi:hypothetical protein